MNLAGISQHIILRGNLNARCFQKTEDFQTYLACLEEISALKSVSIHAYALLGDHVHLLVTPQYADSVSAMIKRLDRAYTRYFNGNYRRSGRLWRACCRPSIVDADNYLLACQRYIELSPVRAGIVEHPAEYIWSSYSANALSESSDLIEPHPVYQALGENKPHRVEAYRQLFSHDLETGFPRDTSAHRAYGYCLGSDAFKLELATKLGPVNPQDSGVGLAEKLHRSQT